MNRQPGRASLIAVGFFLSVGIFLLADLVPASRAEAPEQDAPFCIEMILRGKPYPFVVEHKDGGMVKRTGREDGTCDKLGENVRIEWSDYLGLFPVSWREYYPRRLREAVPTWFSMGTLIQFEPPDLKEAFETLVAEGQVQLNMSYQYNMEAYQCDQSGENCERETEHDDFDIGAVDFKITERKDLTIGGEDYQVWVIDWSSGKIIYSPLLRIPLKSFSYRNLLKEPELYLVSEVVGIHRLKKAAASGRE